MFETLVAWKYLFHPRFQPKILAWLFLCLIQTAVGTLLYYYTPGPPTALLWSAVPIWLLALITRIIKLRREEESDPDMVDSLSAVCETVGTFQILLLVSILLNRPFSWGFYPLGIIPVVSALALWFMNPREKRFSPWVKRMSGLAAAGLAVLFVDWSVSQFSIQYVGAFMVAGGSLLAVVFFLACFFSVFTTISITGVILGAASLVMVRAVTRGFGQEFQDKVLGFNAHVLIMKNTYGFTEYPDVMNKIRSIPHITGAAPFTIAEMIITHEKRHTTVLMKGVDPARVEEVLDLTTYVQADTKSELDKIMKQMGEHLDKGLVGPGRKDDCRRFTEDGDPIPGIIEGCELPAIMLGRDLAKKLRVKTGDVVRLMSPTAEYRQYEERSHDDRAPPPLARDFRVASTFYCGFEEYDQKMAFVHLNAAQRFVNPHALPDEDNAVLGVEIKLDNVYQAGAVAAAIKRKISGMGDYRIITWDQLNRPLFEALRTQKLIMTLIAFIMVIVAGFGILAALSMMVINKTREIAVLKAMGAGAGGVSRVFQLAGVMVGMVGVGCGVGLGILNCRFLSGLNFPLDPKVYLISRLPVLVDWGEMLTVLAAGLILCFLSTLYPSHKASSFHPVEGLRYE